MTMTKHSEQLPGQRRNSSGWPNTTTPRHQHGNGQRDWVEPQPMATTSLRLLPT